MLKKIKQIVQNYICTNVDSRFDDRVKEIPELVAAEADKITSMRIMKAGVNDVLVFPSDTPAEEFDRLVRLLDELNVRGIVVADNVRILRFE